MTVLFDNDISGYRDLLAGTLRATGWDEYNLVEFVTMPEVGLATNSNDREVWRFCQSNSFILLTGNRNQDDETSLEQTLRAENTTTALPVLTIADRQRLPEADYRERCVETLIAIVFDLPNYLGTARQFIP
ncbi:MAG: ACP S-malonyltransferase [Acidobacteria bacterium]|nr:ACP S-malonyltransferase [Acidobacteriota bacterium]